MTDPVYLLVEGMYLGADSIAFDAAFQWRLMRSQGVDARLFVSRFDAAKYPDVEVHPFRDLASTLQREPGLLIYHWVDGWSEADRLLTRTNCPVVLRWHNNTPPWFFANYSLRPAHKTVRGFQEILRISETLPQARVWTNSQFSRRQLGFLGIEETRIDVVHPASTYLEEKTVTSTSTTPRSGLPIRLLFVGRVVPHKGHRHLIASAHALAEISQRPVEVCLPGRADSDMPDYVPELRDLAQRLDVRLEIPGEVSETELEKAYAEADVFVGLSEHEGFGLPILEAMTRQLPVVGYRCSAVSEILSQHPLAVDELDPVEVARRILVALDEPARRALISWQEASILPRFDRKVIANQLEAALETSGQSLPDDANAPEDSPAPTPPPAEILKALEGVLQRPIPPLSLPKDLPRDMNPHFVSRYDLLSYRKLLRSTSTGDLRERALAFQFSSHRPLLGRLSNLFKKAVLRAQDGLLRAIEISHSDLDNRIQTVNQTLTSLARRVGELETEQRKSPPSESDTDQEKNSQD